MFLTSLKVWLLVRTREKFISKFIVTNKVVYDTISCEIIAWSEVLREALKLDSTILILHMHLANLLYIV